MNLDYQSKSDPPQRIGLLEGSLEDAGGIAQVLASHAMAVTHRRQSKEFLNLLWRDSFDALVISWDCFNLPNYQVLRSIRDDLRSSVPVLILSPRNDESELVLALNGGADDYLAKPLRSLEFVARLKVLMRRTRSPASTQARETFGAWVFDRVEHNVSRNDRSIRLPRKQFEVARLLFQHFGCPVSREYLNQRIWNGGALQRTMDTHVSRVRAQLRLTPENGFLLESIYGFGYRLDRAQGSDR